jgi:serine/threonine protein kinase
MSDIDSPHVVRHNDTSQDDETFFILMDFANIGSLKQYLEWRGGVLNEQEAKIIIS